ncbi:MAG: universal stress protein [Desulfobacteraceae bacterium]|nr:universal stress protein [Desulfobacteraceae bacterium]MCF8095579.1 universal stress protein [Desulfobacteraceae bacterium]
MEAIENILVCLDLTEIDASLIDYAAFIADSFKADKVSFVHIIQAYDLSKKSSRSFPDLKTSLNQMVRDELNQRISENFRRNHKTDIEVRVEEEDAAEGLLACVRDLKADLLLLGQKRGEDREARYGRKVAAETTCDVLFVPEKSLPLLEKVLCAVDFTEESRAAFDRALYLSENRGASVTCYFIHDITKAYFPASTPKSADRNQSRAEKKFREFIKTFDRYPENFTCRIEAVDELTSEAQKIYQAAEDEKASLIIVGATGSTDTETSLLGNISESLRRMQKSIPVMIVKHAEEKKFFFQLFD